MASKADETSVTVVSDDSPTVMPLPIPLAGKNVTLPVKTKKLMADRAAFNLELWKKEDESLPVVYCTKRKKRVKQHPQWGYLRRTAEEFFPALNGLARDVSTIVPFFFLFLDYHIFRLTTTSSITVLFLLFTTHIILLQ